MAVNIEEKYPLVTVIAACYNQGKYLFETLDSIKNQTYPNLQLILWDDCSKDKSVELIESWISDNQIECVFLRHSENKGICKSLNEAFGYAKGKYLQLIAMDDILLSDKIERHVAMLENTDKDCALVFSDAYLINSVGNILPNNFIAQHKDNLSCVSGNFFDELIDGNFIPAMSVLYKKDYLDKAGLWDENLAFEDYDMLLRLANKYDFIFDKNCTVKYRLHDTNVHRIVNIENSKLKIYIKFKYNEIAIKKALEILKSAYFSESVEFKNLSKLYFKDIKPEGFLMNCMKYNIPVIIYIKINYIKKLVLKTQLLI